MNHADKISQVLRDIRETQAEEQMAGELGMTFERVCELRDEQKADELRDRLIAERDE
jgi:hypothetical protein